MKKSTNCVTERHTDPLLTTDNLLSARMVTMDGSIVDVSSAGATLTTIDGITRRTTLDPGLWHTIRGGGAGSFGVVVSYTFQMHVPPSYVTQVSASYVLYQVSVRSARLGQCLCQVCVRAAQLGQCLCQLRPLVRPARLGQCLCQVCVRPAQLGQCLCQLRPLSGQCQTSTAGSVSLSGQCKTSTVRSLSLSGQCKT